MAETLAAASGRPVDVFGHSYGGRCALGAALLTDAIRRVVSYEGAPDATRHRAISRRASRRGCGTRLAARRSGRRACRAVHDRGRRDDRRRAGRLPGRPDLAASAPRRPARSCASSTPRRTPAASLEAPGHGPPARPPGPRRRQPAGLPRRHRALDERLADGRIVVIDGARHAAHHTHPDAVVDGGPGVPRPDGPDRRRRDRHHAILQPMLEMGLIGWIVVGFIAGAISGALVGGTDGARLPAEHRGRHPRRDHRRLAGDRDGVHATSRGSSRRSSWRSSDRSSSACPQRHRARRLMTAGYHPA